MGRRRAHAGAGGVHVHDQPEAAAARLRVLRAGASRTATPRARLISVLCPEGAHGRTEDSVEADVEGLNSSLEERGRQVKTSLPHGARFLRREPGTQSRRRSPAAGRPLFSRLGPLLSSTRPADNKGPNLAKFDRTAGCLLEARREQVPRLEATKPHGPALSSMVTCRETSAGARDESPDERIHGSEPRGLRAKGTLVNHPLRLPFRPQSLALATTSRPRLSAFLNLTERAPVRAAAR